MTFLPCLTRSLGGLSLHKANWEDLYNSRVLDNVLETTDDLFSTSGLEIVQQNWGSTHYWN